MKRRNRSYKEPFQERKIRSMKSCGNHVDIINIIESSPRFDLISHPFGGQHLKDHVTKTTPPMHEPRCPINFPK